jgi:hypothetical protein
MPFPPIIALILAGVSTAFGIGSLVCFGYRRPAPGLVFGGICAGSLTLGYYAATKSDPPSWLPLWGWLMGATFGAVAGYWLAELLHSRRKD